MKEGDGHSGLELVPTPTFKKDYKRLRRRHIEVPGLEEVLDLIIGNTPQDQKELRQRHNKHPLKGFKKVYECHIDNAADMLLVWREGKRKAYMMRIGSHDQVLGRRGGQYDIDPDYD